MQLTIIGAGAIGGTVGAHMARAGHDVLLCDTDAEHVAAINAHGLHIEGPVERFTARIRAVTPEGLPGRIEHAAVAVKGQHTRAAALQLRGRLADDGWVVSMQNGLTTDVLADVVGRQRVIASFVNFGADLLAPGRILQGNVATVRVGEPDGGEVTPRVAALADALPYAEATGNIVGYLWGKEAYGAMLWAGAVSDLSIADTLDDPRWAPLMVAIAREVLEQCPVQPEGFDGFEPHDLAGSVTRLADFNRRSAKTHSGIYRDLVVRGRTTEVDVQLGWLRGPLTAHVTELIHAIERGERTNSVANLELLAACERTERLGRPLRAVVRVLPAPLRAAAGPLLGLPVAVKDLIAVGGVPRGNGNPTDMAGPPEAADAPVVAALRAAGADVFATTALLEYAAGALHPDVPETVNPWDPGRTAGGSSGGSAALVAVGACPVALGTDTGGSIRIPAAYCGTVGFKPTYGALPAEGVTPLAPSLDHVGLLATDVSVATRVFAALVGGAAAPPPVRVRLGAVTSQFAHPAVTGEVAAAAAAALDALGAVATMTEVDGTALAAVLEPFEAIILWEAWRVHRATAEAHPGRYGPETLRLLDAGSRVDEMSYRTAMARRSDLVPATAAAYVDVDAVITPVVAYAAPATTPPVDTPEGKVEALFTAAYNVTGAPAVALPCGWTPGGLPVGLQLSAPPGADMALLAVAAVVEAALAPLRAARPAGVEA